MCGIVGLVLREDCRQPLELTWCVHSMAETLVHRGPDAGGVWADDAWPVALGHRRLAILDLSDAGRQPMLSPSGRYVLTFNGEIYNYRELRRELESRGHSFRSHCDTEVLAAGFEEWSTPEWLRRLDGMFAFGLWDREKKRLLLARDRFGEKPLYYLASAHLVAFASELKALRAIPGADFTVNPEALNHFLRFGFIPAPLSIYKEVQKLPPGTWVELSPEAPRPAFPERYWRPIDLEETARQQPFTGSVDEAVEALRTLLSEVVRSRLVSDVPVGAFLSGGIDSSVIVALMQQVVQHPVRTFSVAFNEPGFDESERARRVAHTLGTEHTEVRLTPAEAAEVIPDLADIYDEPFADSSQIPTLLVSKVAAASVRVSLSGDGGDELFAGYHRHWLGPEVWRRLKRWPKAARALTGSILQATPASLFRKLERLLPEPFGAYHSSIGASAKLHRGSLLLPASSLSDLYDRFLSICAEDYLAAEVSGCAAKTGLCLPESSYPEDSLRWLTLADILCYLPNDILVKLDRAAMAFSLESRVPFLSPAVLAFARSLPPSFLSNGRQGKVVLRRLLERFLPHELIIAEKRGFAVPIGEWLCGPLRDWAEDLFSESKLRKTGLLDVRRVRRLWQSHQRERGRWDAAVWTCAVLQSWSERWL